MTILINGKELILDHQGEEAKYPKEVPIMFRSGLVEDYNKEICTYLCRDRRNISWESLYNYKLNTCEMDKYGDGIDNDNGNGKVSVTKQHSCSASNVCLGRTAFASTNIYVNYLRLEDANLSATQLRNRVHGDITQIWIKSEASYYTVRNINVQKTFGEFLAEIGGNLGLFAGASILTLVEFGEFCVKVIKGIFFNGPEGPA